MTSEKGGSITSPPTSPSKPTMPMLPPELRSTTCTSSSSSRSVRQTSHVEPFPANCTSEIATERRHRACGGRAAPSICQRGLSVECATGDMYRGALAAAARRRTLTRPPSAARTCSSAYLGGSRSSSQSEGSGRALSGTLRTESESSWRSVRVGASARGREASDAALTAAAVVSPIRHVLKEV
eukprot:scaffold272849_cov26-Tisochrysis_lutea.AAC.1